MLNAFLGRLRAGETDFEDTIALINALYDEMTRPAGEPLQAGIDSTVHSHVLTFAAEEARLTRRTVDVAEFARRIAPLRAG